jgi:hypothetical protein
MNWILADILHGAGTSQYNGNIRQKILCKSLSQDDKRQLPSHFLRTPQFYNHGELELVNMNAFKVGVQGEDAPFHYCCPLPPDNNERFFTEYFTQQKKRNLLLDNTSNIGRCPCEYCLNNSIKLVHETVWPDNMATAPEDTSVAKAVVGRKKRQKKVTKTSPVIDIPVPTGATAQVFPFPFVNPVYSTYPFGVFPPRLYPQQQYPFGIMAPYGVGSMTPSTAAVATTTAAKRKRKRKPRFLCCRPMIIWDNNGLGTGNRPPHDPVNCRRLFMTKEEIALLEK